MRAKGKCGFTIIELITVISMILLLMGAITASVSGARKRAKIQQAITEAQQLTDAILAYENFAPGQKTSPLREEATGEGWKEASEANLDFVLGKKAMPNGKGNVPVLFNVAVTGGSVRDPWGHTYRYRIMSEVIDEDDNHKWDNRKGGFAIPNINRIPTGEVN